MFNALKNKINSEENIKKDFRKLANYVILAKGQHRTINGFAADMKTNADYLALIVNARISCYPTMPFLKLIADNSGNRVSLKDLTLACGYSNYSNNDLEQIKNVKVSRGGIYYANFGDRGIDSEVCGHRPVLVVQNTKGNMFSSNTKVLTITSRSKAKLITHIPVGIDHGLKYDSIICCELEDTISKRRLISGSGVVQKIAECSDELMLRVSVALAKADGIIGLNIPEKDAIEVLIDLNKGKTKTYQYENNYNTKSQVAFA